MGWEPFSFSLYLSCFVCCDANFEQFTKQAVTAVLNCNACSQVCRDCLINHSQTEKTIKSTVFINFSDGSYLISKRYSLNVSCFNRHQSELLFKVISGRIYQDAIASRICVIFWSKVSTLSPPTVFSSFSTIPAEGFWNNREFFCGNSSRIR